MNANAVATSPSQLRPTANPTTPIAGEPETDGLGKTRRRLRFAFSWRTESPCQRVPEQQTVRGAAHAAERSDREHRGLHGEHDRVAGQQHDSENDCGNRRGKPQSAWIYESGRTGHEDAPDDGREGISSRQGRRTSGTGPVRASDTGRRPRGTGRPRASSRARPHRPARLASPCPRVDGTDDGCLLSPSRPHPPDRAEVAFGGTYRA